VLTQLVGPLGASLHILFIMMFALGALGLLSALLLPSGAVSSKPASEDEQTAVPVEAAAHQPGGGAASAMLAD
jgi:hypothetical protein